MTVSERVGYYLYYTPGLQINILYDYPNKIQECSAIIFDSSGWPTIYLHAFQREPSQIFYGFYGLFC